MNTIYYTDAHEELDSELVYDVWYDAKTQEAHVNLTDSIYTYHNVPAEAVKALVEAPSVGREFNGSLFGSKGFKRTYGPGTKVGSFYNVDLVERELANAAAPSAPAPGLVPKNLTYAEGAKVTEGNTNPSQVRVSLQAKPVVPNKHEQAVADLSARLDAKKVKRTHTVHFESNGSRTYTLEATSVEEAVAALGEVAEMLGVSAKVTGVFVHLG